MNNGYSLSEVLEEAERAGYPLTRHQLKRLRQNGLVQTPRPQHSKGRPGSDSVYSQQDLDQLLGVLRLKHDHGHEKFATLRVSAWLDGWNVDFNQLRPDVVDLLRKSMTGQQGLVRGAEDDGISRRLRQGLAEMPKRDLVMVDQLLEDGAEKPTESVTFGAMALAMVQLIVGTAHADASRDQFDSALRIENEEGEELSDLYLKWDLPPTPQWPRIISRTGEKWFEPGRLWLVLVTIVVQEGHIEDRAGSPLTLWIVNEVKQRLPNPSHIELRNLIACLGIVLAKNNPARLIEFFDNLDP